MTNDDQQGLQETNLNSLSDDYIKFGRLTQYLAKSTGCTTIGLIANNSFLDGITHRKIRELLFVSVNTSNINLHCSVMQREEIPECGFDENLFDIQRGIVISMTWQHSHRAYGCVSYADLIGTREEKYKRLLSRNLTEWTELQPQAPYFFFQPKGLHEESEYLKGFPLNKAFLHYSSGIKFRKDNLQTARPNPQPTDGAPREMTTIIEDVTGHPVVIAPDFSRHAYVSIPLG